MSESNFHIKNFLNDAKVFQMIKVYFKMWPCHPEYNKNKNAERFWNKFLICIFLVIQDLKKSNEERLVTSILIQKLGHKKSSNRIKWLMM